MNVPIGPAAPGTVTPFSVSNCTYRVVTMGEQTATNCTAFGWFIEVQLAFGFSATLYSNGGSSITSHYTPIVQTFPPVTSNGSPVVYVIRSKQSGSSPA